MLIVFPRTLSKIGFRWSAIYNRNLLKWQKNFVKPIINKYCNYQNLEVQQNNDYVIWTCWWQGEENMPEVIQQCHQSLLRNSNGHKVVLITKENISSYLTFPDWLMEKVKDGIISLSHFSDIIRLSLLEKYGGAWVDSALFLTRPFDPTTEFYMPRLVEDHMTINQGKWSFGVMKGPKGDVIFKFMLDSLLLYWKKYNAPIDYLMFDGFLRIAYEEILQVKEEIDRLKISSPDLHMSRYLFDKACDKNKFESLISNNDFLSLTWRIKYSQTTPTGESTYYGELIRRFSPSKAETRKFMN